MLVQGKGVNFGGLKEGGPERHIFCFLFFQYFTRTSIWTVASRSGTPGSRSTCTKSVLSRAVHGVGAFYRERVIPRLVPLGGGLASL